MRYWQDRLESRLRAALTGPAKPETPSGTSSDILLGAFAPSCWRPKSEKRTHSSANRVYRFTGTGGALHTRQARHLPAGTPKARNASRPPARTLPVRRLTPAPRQWVCAEYSGRRTVFMAGGTAGGLPHVGHFALYANGINSVVRQDADTGDLSRRRVRGHAIGPSDKCWGFGGKAPKVRRCGMGRCSRESPTEGRSAKLPESATGCRAHLHHRERSFSLCPSPDGPLSYPGWKRERP